MFLITLINALIIATVVMVHYETLYRLARIIPILPIRPRFRIVVGIYGALIGLVLETPYEAGASVGQRVDGVELFHETSHQRVVERGEHTGDVDLRQMVRGLVHGNAVRRFQVEVPSTRLAS